MFTNDRYRKASCGFLVVSPSRVVWAIRFQFEISDASPRVSIF
jgi:hypothetical protein